MKTSHDIRNWLHYLILAAQAMDHRGVATCFTREEPLHIQGPRPEDHWENWENWAAFLGSTLGALKIGDLHLRMTRQPEITISEALPEAAVHWQMAYRLGRLDSSPKALSCEAILVIEQERWVARSLICLPLILPPIPDQGA